MLGVIITFIFRNVQTYIIICCIFSVQSLPFTYYMYCLIPVVLWMFVALRYVDINEMSYLATYANF